MGAEWVALGVLDRREHAFHAERGNLGVPARRRPEDDRLPARLDPRRPGTGPSSLAASMMRRQMAVWYFAAGFWERHACDSPCHLLHGNYVLHKKFMESPETHFDELKAWALKF